MTSEVTGRGLTLVLKACLLESVSTLFTMVPCRGEGPVTLLEQTKTTASPTDFRVETTSWWNMPVRSMPLTSSNWSPFQNLPVVPTGPWGRMERI